MENIVRKGEIACNTQFLLFSQCFLHYMALIFHFKSTLKVSSAICFNLDQYKILLSGNGLITLHQSNASNYKAMAMTQLFLSNSLVNPLPNNKNLDLSKLKAFADNKMNVANMMIYV